MSAFAKSYRFAAARAAGVPVSVVERAGVTVCPIESGHIGGLADHECRHGRLPGDPTPECGCWTVKGMYERSRPRPLSRESAQLLGVDLEAAA